MSKYHNDETEASDPVGVSLDLKKLQPFKKELRLWDRLRLRFIFPDDYIDEHMQEGDSRAAVVVGIDDKLTVAAYSDELDCVVLLEFPLVFVKAYSLRYGSRLLTVNTYADSNTVVNDLIEGPRTLGNYHNYYPVIVEFLSSDMDKIESRKSSIGSEEWDRTLKMGQTLMDSGVALKRDGNPYCSDIVVSGEYSDKFVLEFQKSFQ